MTKRKLIEEEITAELVFGRVMNTLQNMRSMKDAPIDDGQLPS